MYAGLRRGVLRARGWRTSERASGVIRVRRSWDRVAGEIETKSLFDPSTVSARAGKAWRAQGLAAITLHECRHTFASLMIAAGVNAKALRSGEGIEPSNRRATTACRF